MRIAIGTDHAGYVLKDTFVDALRKAGHQVIDLGTCGPEPVDYPDFAKAVGESIQKGEAERGILVCGSGAGVAIAANKMNGIKAAVCQDSYTAHQCVEHDNVNVFCLGPRVVGTDLALDLLHIWLNASFTNEPRHVRRVDKIDEIERLEGCP